MGQHRVGWIHGAIALGLALSASGMAVEAADPADQAAQVEALNAELLDQPVVQDAGAGVQLLQARSARSKAEVAKERKAALKALMEAAPAEVLRLALPASVRAGLPAEVQPHLESHLVAEGHLRTGVRDYADHAEYDHTLLGLDGREHVLHFAGEAPTLGYGSRVLVAGIVVDDQVALSGQPLASGDPSTETTGLIVLAAAAVPASDTLGQQDTLVVLVNFQDNPGNKPLSWSLVNDMFFPSGYYNATKYFYDTSFQKTWLSGGVHGWYTLGINRPTDCKRSTIEDIFYRAVNNKVPDSVWLPGYDRFIVMFPNIPACGWAGWAFTIGKETFGTEDGNVTASRGFVILEGNWSVDRDTAIHELGHGIGVGHANGLDCGGSVELPSGCTVQEYSDPFDVMGNAPGGLMNAVHRDRLHWLDPSNIVTIGAGTNADFDIHTLSYTQPYTGARVLKIFDRVNDQGCNLWYYVEFRQPWGFDGHITNDPVKAGAINGALIHRMNECNDTSVLLDMTPNSRSPGDFQDAALPISWGAVNLNGVSLDALFKHYYDQFLRLHVIKNCHILTAAFGRADHPAIQALWTAHQRLVGRRWDAPWHRGYLAWYDAVGPRIAAWVSDKPWLRAAIRGWASLAARLARWGMQG
jgi:hypothetical protein